MKLALTLPLNSDETLYSYASRLAQLNGSYYAQDFAADMRVYWHLIKQGQPEAVRGISELTGIPTKRLNKAAQFSIDHQWFSFRDQKYHRVLQTRRLLKVCPTCMQKELAVDRFTPYRRAQWELAQYNACSKHRQLLITLPQAPLPRDPLDFSGYLRERETDLRSEIDHPIEVKTTNVPSYLEERYLGSQTHHWLDQFDLDIAATFVQNLGLLYLRGGAFRPRELDRKLAHEAGEIGISVCRGGDDAVIQCLLECKQKSSHPKGGYFRDFGFFYLWIARRPRLGRMNGIRDLFREFIFDNYPVETGEVILEKPCPERRIHTWTTAANTYNLQYTRAYALRDAIAKPEHKISFPAGTYHRELSALKHDVFSYKAAEYLSVSYLTLDRMEKAGLIKPRLSLTKMRDVYNYEDLDDFLAHITCNAKPLPQNPEGLAPINKIGLHAKTTMVEAFRKILDGSIKRIFVAEEGRAIGAIWIDPDEVGALIDADLDVPTELVCRKDLAKLLKVSTTTVAHLCDRGFFKTIMVYHPRRGCRLKCVTHQEIERFLEKYISGGELAKMTGLQGNQLFALLQKRGIDPIDLPPKIGKIYLRSQIPAEML